MDKLGRECAGDGEIGGRVRELCFARGEQGELPSTVTRAQGAIAAGSSRPEEALPLFVPLESWSIYVRSQRYCRGYGKVN